MWSKILAKSAIFAKMAYFSSEVLSNILNIEKSQWKSYIAVWIRGLSHLDPYYFMWSEILAKSAIFAKMAYLGSGI